MQRQRSGFWRKAAVSLALLGLLALGLLLPGRWSDLWTTLFPPPPPPPIPRATEDRASLAGQLAGPSGKLEPHTLPTLWRLIGDENDFVRGQALEVLALAGEGARLDPRRAERIREIATDDTDWNRRSACVLLVQRDPVSALAYLAPLWAKTKNANTKAALVAALKAADATSALADATRRDATRRDATRRDATRAREPATLAPFAREALEAMKPPAEAP